jgi:membrane protease YdiL (CAAX protease family)
VLVFLITLGGVVVWSRLQGSDQINVLLTRIRWTRDILLGIVLGLTLNGLIQVCLGLLPKARRFSLPVLAGITSSPLVRVLGLTLVAFTEELWRARCLNATASDGATGPQALMAVSAAYALAYWAFGTASAVSEGIAGVALGAVFLWSGSILVTFTMHAVMQTQILLFASAAAPNVGPAEIRRKPFTRCPACNAPLNLQQVRLDVSESFLCPHCRARLTSSDSRRRFFRWGSAIMTTAILYAGAELVPDVLRGTSYWLVLVGVVFLGIGLFSLLHLAFPPTLQFGDPDFVRLNLRDRVERDLPVEGNELKSEPKRHARKSTPD